MRRINHAIVSDHLQILNYSTLRSSLDGTKSTQRESRLNTDTKIRIEGLTEFIVSSLEIGHYLITFHPQLMEAYTAQLRIDSLLNNQLRRQRMASMTKHGTSFHKLSLARSIHFTFKIASTIDTAITVTFIGSLENAITNDPILAVELDIIFKRSRS